MVHQNIFRFKPTVTVTACIGAMSRILYGNENIHVELRVRTFVGLCLNKYQYLDDDYLKELTGLGGCIEKLFDSSFDTSADVKGKDKMQRYNGAWKLA